jgi:hypothetical protein
MCTCSNLGQGEMYVHTDALPVSAKSQGMYAIQEVTFLLGVTTVLGCKQYLLISTEPQAPSPTLGSEQPFLQKCAFLWVKVVSWAIKKIRAPCAVIVLIAWPICVLEY